PSFVREASSRLPIIPEVERLPQAVAFPPVKEVPHFGIVQKTLEIADGEGGTHGMAKVRSAPRKATQKRQTTHTPPRRRSPSPSPIPFTPALLAQAVDLVHIIDATGTIRYVSPAITRLLGYQPKDVQGKDSFGFVHPDDVQMLRLATADLLRHPRRAV